MIENVGYLISSYRDYEAPLQQLLSSMDAIDPARIRVVVGGYDRRDVWFSTVVRADHASFDYTALIDFVEYPDEYPAWPHVFLLHDTMTLGPDADRLIRAADPRWPAVAVWGGQCNLGLYRADYLRSCADQLAGLKDCSKAYAVEMEGFLWRQLPADQRGHYAGTIEVSEEWPVYGGTPRRVEYYSGVDVTKYKANWGQHPVARVVQP